MFDPKCNKFPYPVETDRHYLVVKKDDGTVFDENYPYIDTSKKFARKVKFVRFLLAVIVKPLVRIRLNLRIKGKENLKKYKDVLDQGFISVCNHVHMWDYLGIITTISKRKPKIISWDKNISGENGKLIRMTGGIPFPSDNFRGQAKFFRATTDYIKNGGWLHIYAEGSMWEFYQPIRPFKSGAAYFSVKCNRPILPLAYSYRKNGWIRRKIFKSPASFTLNIGEPIYPDTSLTKLEAEEKLTIEAHEAVCRLAGIDPKDDYYPPIFKDSKRVDYYTKEYGIGYKKSW